VCVRVCVCVCVCVCSDEYARLVIYMVLHVLHFNWYIGTLLQQIARIHARDAAHARDDAATRYSVSLLYWYKSTNTDILSAAALKSKALPWGLR